MNDTPTKPPALRPVVGVDVGGTFTDLFYFDAHARMFHTAKVPSERGNEAAGFMAGLGVFGPVAQLGSIVHGTTVGTNALLERKGGRVGVITTTGFRDVLEMRRRDRRQTWGLWGNFVPIAERDFRLEVDERTLADGTIRTPVDIDTGASGGPTPDRQGAEALAIIFINAYANADNERARSPPSAIVWPNDNIAASHQILNEIREFERASTTAINATLQPVVGSYLSRLETALDRWRFRGTLSHRAVQRRRHVDGTARRLPVRTALSGPAAGVIAGASHRQGRRLRQRHHRRCRRHVVRCRLIADGAAALALETKIDFGLVIRTPMIEMTTIGAGGGSIARVDKGGMLEVGPESAGSRPGPACYGQGNTRPTLTDANLVLGRISADRPIGGLSQSRCRREPARNLDARGTPLELDVMRLRRRSCASPMRAWPTPSGSSRWSADMSRSASC